MKLSQSKIDLAVLWKLFQRANAVDDAARSGEVADAFDVAIPTRRIQLALEELEARGEAQRTYDTRHGDVGLWHITRDGVRTVERAIRVPSSFISRLNSAGDHWLESEDAMKATLSKNPRYSDAKPADAKTPFRQLADETLLAAADLQGKFDQRSIELKLVLESIDSPQTVEKQQQLLEYLENKGLIDSSDSTLGSLSLRVTGDGAVEAERLVEERDAEMVREDSSHVFSALPDVLPSSPVRNDINWTKWGTILTGIAILVAVGIAVVS